MEAISAVSALDGKSWDGREFVFCEQVGDMVLTEVEFMSMIRNKEWKLVHYLNSEEGQLYNLKNDPTETSNIGSPEYQSQKRHLLDQLLNWRVDSQIRHPVCWIHQKSFFLNKPTYHYILQFQNTKSTQNRWHSQEFGSWIDFSWVHCWFW